MKHYSVSLGILGLGVAFLSIPGEGDLPNGAFSKGSSSSTPKWSPDAASVVVVVVGSLSKGFQEDIDMACSEVAELISCDWFVALKETMANRCTTFQLKLQFN